MSSAKIVPAGKIRIAIVGMGLRLAHMARLMCDADPEVEIAAIADPDKSAASTRAAALRGGSAAPIFSDAESLLGSSHDFDAVLIGTQCHLHAAMAIAVARNDLPLFLEKPVAISWQQLDDLANAYADRETSVVVSFPLRLTQHVRTAVDLIRSGRLGAVNQIQAVNNVPYGGVYFGQWYRDYEKTGGLWLQKATHDLDYVNCLMAAASSSSFPLRVMAMHSRTVYGGNMPPELLCSRCDRIDVCPESPQNLLIRGSDGGVLNHTQPRPNSDHFCTFSSSILNQDAGSALVMYSNGAHASYTQNFLPRLSAGFRGATVVGYEATLRFDWQSDTITVINHHNSRVDRIEISGAGMHGGGDAALARNFVDVVRGRDVSSSSLSDGLLSAAMCLAARDAAEAGSAQPIPYFGNRPQTPINVTPRGPIEPAHADRSIHTT